MGWLILSQAVLGTRVMEVQPISFAKILLGHLVTLSHLSAAAGLYAASIFWEITGLSVCDLFGQSSNRQPVMMNLLNAGEIRLRKEKTMQFPEGFVEKYKV